jgi:polar amino acid transport system permease protein
LFADFGLQNLEPLLEGAKLTLYLVAMSGLIGTGIGLAFGLARVAPFAPARWLAAVYVNFVRGQPVLIILLFLYFAIPLAVPSATFERGPTAIVGLSVYAGAYIAEIVRGSVEAIPRGQGEAASALGMGYLLRYRYVILPQAMKIAVPPTIGFLISLVKASSLVSVIGYVELTKAGRIVSTLNQEPLVTFLIVAALYFVLSYPIALFGRWYERRLV